MRVRGAGETAGSILQRPIPTHLFEVPPAPGTFGVWQVRQVRSAPLGYVLSRHELGAIAYYCYAHAETMPAGVSGCAGLRAGTAPSRG
jgi:hypothetical protein